MAEFDSLLLIQSAQACRSNEDIVVLARNAIVPITTLLPDACISLEFIEEKTNKVETRSLTSSAGTGDAYYFPAVVAEKKSVLVGLRVQVSRPLSAEVRQLVGIVHMILTTAANMVIVQRRAATDELLQIANRGQFEADLEKQVSQLGGKRKIALILFDIDRFKDINDQYGHATGDEVLKGVAKTLRELARKGKGEIYRYGGEELGLVVPVRDRSEAQSIADKGCVAIRKRKMIVGSASITVTISAGFAVGPEDGASAQKLKEHADQALYLAKRMGRDRAIGYEQVAGMPAAEAETLKKAELQEKLEQSMEMYYGALRGAFEAKFQPVSSDVTVEIMDIHGREVRVTDVRKMKAKQDLREGVDKFVREYWSDGTIHGLQCMGDVKVHSVIQIAPNRWLAEFLPARNVGAGSRVNMTVIHAHREAFTKARENFEFRSSGKTSFRLKIRLLFPLGRIPKLVRLLDKEQGVLKSVKPRGRVVTFSVAAAERDLRVEWDW